MVDESRDGDSALVEWRRAETEAVPDPLPVPTGTGELDEAALATRLDVDRSDRPYPERVLWRAFAYTAFDLHAGATPELAQLATGHVLLASDRFEAD